MEYSEKIVTGGLLLGIIFFLIGIIFDITWLIVLGFVVAVGPLAIGVITNLLSKDESQRPMLSVPAFI